MFSVEQYRSPKLWLQAKRPTCATRVLATLHTNKQTGLGFDINIREHRLLRQFVYDK